MLCFQTEYKRNISSQDFLCWKIKLFLIHVVSQKKLFSNKNGLRIRIKFRTLTVKHSVIVKVIKTFVKISKRFKWCFIGPLSEIKWLQSIFRVSEEHVQ